MDNKLLKEEVADLTAQLSAALNTGKGRRKGKNVPDPEIHEAALFYGKKFAIVGRLWIPDEAFAASKPDPLPSPSDAFKNDENYTKAAAIALYDFLPEDLHPHISTKVFKQNVRSSPIILFLHISTFLLCS